MSELKTELYKKCLEFAESQVINTRQAIESAEQASKNDTKSSAGDKYETGREMMTQEINRLSHQLQEAGKLIEALKQVDITKRDETVRVGSLVLTDKGNFFIAIGAGQIRLTEKIYFAISRASPLAAKFAGLAAGKTIEFNDKTYTIEAVL